MPRVRRYLQGPPFNRPLRALVAQLPLSALLPLLAAIFFLFGILGPVMDVMDGGRHAPPVVVRNAVASGVMAAGFAFGSLRRNWIVIAAMTAISIAWSHLTAGTTVAMPVVEAAARRQLAFDGIATLALTMVSYGCFLWFINATAARYLRARTEIELARDIHTVLVPPVERGIGDFEFFGSSQASGDVGGDLIDVVETGSGWFAYIADVSGHGVSSGVVMAMFKSALRMRLRQGADIGPLLTDLNAVLLPLKSSAMYVTVACVRGRADGTLDCAVAGHLPILRVTPAGVEEVTMPQIPVGMFEDYAFSSLSIACAPGDLLALLTDGLIEVFDAHDRELGLAAMKTLLAASATLPLREVANAVVAKARAHGPQIDDQTLLLIRRR
ncbi:MAG TPA: PP2C family protein-serine/threonine phosphatase [Vicinamibacterales bacterium]